MDKDYSITLFVSTGRCGTTFLADSMEGSGAFICHELEVPDVKSVLRDLYIPAALSGDLNQALHVVDYYKLPQIKHALQKSGKSQYIDVGHQYNYAIYPALLSRCANISLVRLRRDRFETALSFMTTDPVSDIWNVENYDGYFRWMMSPYHKIVQNQAAVLDIWPQLTRLQKVIWAIDEVERMWSKLLRDFHFPYLEYDFMDLKAGNFTNLEQFLCVSVVPTESGRAMNSSRFWERKKPEITRMQFDLEDAALQERYDHHIKSFV